ncbi:AAA family ATPase [Oceanobacter kriegii]|uniref:AAA family ATPase n=1 Tax=Oceanobacter kriegii TaxID=64972 RepID=UPI0004271E6E|nr:AAA family ATPase [Oceanobacter kriegii]
MSSFIVLEALDGVGKTTLAKNLSEHHSYKFLTTPGKELQPLRADIINGLGKSQTARALFYAATVQAEGERAASLCSQGQSVVMDRYSASTIAYAKARGVNTDLEAALSQAVKPDLTILLTLDEQERQQRLRQRGTTAEDLETLQPVFRQQVMAGLRQRCDIELDVSGLDQQQALQELVAIIKSHCPT